jgi:hypothetical protein
VARKNFIFPLAFPVYYDILVVVPLTITDSIVPKVARRRREIPAALGQGLFVL